MVLEIWKDIWYDTFDSVAQREAAINGQSFLIFTLTSSIECVIIILLALNNSVAWFILQSRV